MNRKDSKFSRAVRDIRSAFIAVAVFSAAINILMLTGPLFMLQIYDRVMSSGSVPTLVALSVLVAGLYAVMGLFTFLRTRVMTRAGAWLDGRIGKDAMRVWICRGVALGNPDALSHRPLADLALVRAYIATPALMALFDLPWFPFYLAVLFLFHFKLGLLGLAGAAVVTALALLNLYMTSRPLEVSAAIERNATAFAEQSYRNSEAVMAMGMLDNLSRYWERLHRQAMHHGQRGSDRSEAITSASKAFRMLLQSALLAFGAYLALRHEISSGSIIAGSIIGGRALAPIDQTIAGWKHTLRARRSYKRLKAYLAGVTDSAEKAPTALPEPKGAVKVSNVVKLAPDGSLDEDGRKRVILEDVNFELLPGAGLGVIGPSASGKTTLARLLTGVWMPDSGSVRLDGATLDQWDSNILGRYIGYLPQSYELIAGTIAQNISRFDPQARDEDIIAAAMMASVHEMILSLPDGYATHIGQSGSRLSAGQRQRIALARAVYRTPKLVVLDEPNSNLDSEGDAALTRAIEQLRMAGSAVVVMAHRPSAIAAVDDILMLGAGKQMDIGPKPEVLRRFTRIANG